MTDKVIVQGEINNDGELIIQLPPDVPRGSVKVTIEQASINIEIDDFDEELEAIIDDSLNSESLTMGEIELPDAPIFDDDFPDGKIYVDQIRSKRRYAW